MAHTLSRLASVPIKDFPDGSGQISHRKSPALEIEALETAILVSNYHFENIAVREALVHDLFGGYSLEKSWQNATHTAFRNE